MPLTATSRPCNAAPRLAPRLAATIAVKAVLLALIWAAFIRGHQVAVDADAVAAAFQLPAGATGAPGASSGEHHGQ